MHLGKLALHKNVFCWNLQYHKVQQSTIGIDRVALLLYFSYSSTKLDMTFDNIICRIIAVLYELIINQDISSYVYNVN